MKKSKRRCPNCKKWFIPDPRTRDRQQFCSEPACKKASKVARQKRWLAKPGGGPFALDRFSWNRPIGRHRLRSLARTTVRSRPMNLTAGTTLKRQRRKPKVFSLFLQDFGISSVLTCKTGFHGLDRFMKRQ